MSAKEKEKSTVSTRRPKNTKQRRNSNGFESRHNYVPQWNTPQAWGNQPPQYVPIGSVYQGPPSGYPGQVSGHYPNGAHMNGPGPQGPGYHPQAYGPNGSVSVYYIAWLWYMTNMITSTPSMPQPGDTLPMALQWRLMDHPVFPVARPLSGSITPITDRNTAVVGRRQT